MHNSAPLLRTSLPQELVAKSKAAESHVYFNPRAPYHVRFPPP